MCGVGRCSALDLDGWEANSMPTINDGHILVSLVFFLLRGAGVSPCPPPPHTHTLSDSYATVCLCSSSSIFSKNQQGVVSPTRLSGLIVGKVSA